MQGSATVTLSILLSAAAAAGVALALKSDKLPSPGIAGVTAEEFQASVAALKKENQGLRDELAGLRAPTAALANQRTVLPTVSDEQIAAAVQHYLETHGALPADAASAKGVAIDLPTAFAELRKGNYWSNSEAWKRIFASGKMDDLIKMFEQRAKDNATDPAAHMELANAYLAYLQMDNTKWPLSMKADGEFDKVLELDENNWPARFTKAVSYTFWPDFLGKKKEAISQFERLVQQQDSMPVQSDQAQTYVYLGNLLEQRGDAARAREIWQRGLTRHPDNADLRHKLGQ